MNQITLPNPLSPNSALTDYDPTIRDNTSQEKPVVVSQKSGQESLLSINRPRVSLNQPSPLSNIASLANTLETFKDLSSRMKGNQSVLQNALAETANIFTSFLVLPTKDGDGLHKDTAKGAEHSLGGALFDFGSSSVANFGIYLTKMLAEIKEGQTTLKSEEIKQARAKNETQMKDNQIKVKEADEAKDKAKDVGFFGKIFGYISAAVSIFVGIAMCCTGVGLVAGVAMIVGGACGLASQILQEPAVQDGLKDLGVDVKALQTVMTVLEITSAVISTLATFGGAALAKGAQLAGKVSLRVADGLAKAAGKLNDLAKIGTAVNKFSSVAVATKIRFVATSTETAANVAQGAAATTGMAYQANATEKQALAQESRADVTAMRAMIDRINNEIRLMNQVFQDVFQDIMKMIKAEIDSMTEILHRPATI